MYRRLEVPGDNSCLFHAVGHFVGQSGQDLRSLAVRSYAQLQDLTIHDMTLRAWIQLSEDIDLEVYAARMANRNAWGGALELLVFAHIFQRPISVYVMTSKTSARVIATFGRTFKGKPIFLLYVQNNHYVGLLEQK